MYHKRTFEEYIKFLELRWGSTPHSYPTRPMGGGNPYYCCKHCGVTDPEINGDVDGHLTNCRWRQMYKSIQGLKRVLKEEKEWKAQK